MSQQNTDYGRPWHDRRTAKDAVGTNTPEEDAAWAAGWNAAVAECVRQQDAIFAREMGTQSGRSSDGNEK